MYALKELYAAAMVQANAIQINWEALEDPTDKQRLLDALGVAHDTMPRLLEFYDDAVLDWVRHGDSSVVSWLANEVMRAYVLEEIKVRMTSMDSL